MQTKEKLAETGGDCQSVANEFKSRQIEFLTAKSAACIASMCSSPTTCVVFSALTEQLGIYSTGCGAL
jgi:hypothetical protein